MDGHIDGYDSEGEVDEPVARVQQGEQKGEEKGASSKVRRNVDEMDGLRRRLTHSLHTAFTAAPHTAHLASRTRSCVGLATSQAYGLNILLSPRCVFS